MIKVLRGTILIVLFAYSLRGQEEGEPCQRHKRMPDYVAQGFHIVWDFNKNFFSWDTVKIMAAFAPFYVASRYIDKELHSCFYCDKHHKNLRQLPKTCTHIANQGVTAVLIGLASLTVFPVNREIKDTAIIFSLALPFMWAWKKVFKEIRADGCRRPKNELFSKHKKYYGGCPSGHLVTATFAAAYWGMQLGPAWGVPLGIFAGAVFVDLVNCNRHFASQMVAGAGLGFIGAVAASKVADVFKQRDMECCLVSDTNTQGLKISWNF